MYFPGPLIQFWWCDCLLLGVHLLPSQYAWNPNRPGWAEKGQESDALYQYPRPSTSNSKLRQQTTTRLFPSPYLSFVRTKESEANQVDSQEAMELRTSAGLTTTWFPCEHNYYKVFTWLSVDTTEAARLCFMHPYMKQHKQSGFLLCWYFRYVCTFYQGLSVSVDNEMGFDTIPSVKLKLKFLSLH